MSKKLSWPVAFTALTLIWGASFLFIAVSGTFLPPVGVAFWRMVLGAAALFVIITIQGHKLPKVGKAWLHTVIAGLFMSSIPFTLFAFGELHIASGLAGMINAATPVMTVLVILVAFRDQTPTRTQVIGLSIGILGTLVLLGVWNGFGENDPISVIALLGATLCYGIGSPYIRKFVSPLGMPNTVAVFMQLFTSSLTLLPFYLAGPITTGAANDLQRAGYSESAAAGAASNPFTVRMNPAAMTKGSPKVLMAGATLQLPSHESLLSKHLVKPAADTASTLSTGSEARRHWVRYP